MSIDTQPPGLKNPPDAVMGRALGPLMLILGLWGAPALTPVAVAEAPPTTATASASVFDPRAARQQAMVGFGHLRQQDYGKAHAALSAAFEQWPNHPQIAYGLALSETALGHLDAALERLRQMTSQGYALPVEGEDGFDALRQSAAFADLLEELEALATESLGHSEQVFALAEPDLIPEAVVFDPQSGDYFVSSVHRRKILRRHADGRVDTFAEKDLWAVSGLAVDSRQRLLWAASSAMPNMQGYRPEDDGNTALVAFDLDSGVEQWRFESRQPGHRLADLTVAPDGTVYVSDGAEGIGRIWRTVTSSGDEGEVWRRRLPAPAPPSASPQQTIGDADPASPRQTPVGLELISPPDSLRSPQGLALSADGGHLFVADYSYGLLACELATGEWFHFAEPPGVALLGIDGLNIFGNDLVAIQNGVQPQRILRLRPDLRSRRIVASKILAMHLPPWSEPTLGTVVGDDFIYVGNSQWDRFDADGRLPSVEELAPPSIQRLQLGGWAIPSMSSRPAGSGGEGP